MPIIVTPRWSGSRLVKRSFAYVALQEWDVTGVLDKYEAIDLAIPVGTVLAENQAMTVSHRDADPTGPISWRVRAEFGFGDPGAQADNPINEPARILWEKDNQTAPRVLDTSGNQIVNSAGTAFSPPRTRFIPCLVLLVEKYLPFYNVQLGLQYADSVNSKAFTVAGAGGVDPGQCYCDYILPVEPYTNQWLSVAPVPYVKVKYRFRFQPGVEPWQDLPIDQGLTGWYSKSGTPTIGPFCDSNLNLANFPIPLDGKGRPIDMTNWKVYDGVAAQNAIVNPNPPPGLLVDSSRSDANTNILLWRDVRRTDFSALGL